MTYRNITTATNAILGRTRGTQNNYIRAHYGASAVNYASKSGNGERSIFEKPDKFETWFNKGLEVYKKRGYKFQWLNLGTLKVTLPDGRTGSRTYEDFYQEWKFEYCVQFPSFY